MVTTLYALNPMSLRFNEPLTSDAGVEALINEAVSHLVSVTYDDTDIYVSSINYILVIFLSLNIITITAIKIICMHTRLEIKIQNTKSFV